MVASSAAEIAEIRPQKVAAEMRNTEVQDWQIAHRRKTKFSSENPAHQQQYNLIN